MTPDIKKNPNQLAFERGVYTLANDVVIEWFHAFIRSFRKTNPHLPLTVIPYNEKISRLKELQKQFNFEIMDGTLVQHYDALADKVRVIKKEAGTFRKFACFSGKYREFLFLDADIVVLMGLDRLFDAFSKSAAQFVYFDTAIGACYKENFAAVMVPEYGSPAYNSGAFFSRRETITESQIYAIADKATAICEGFAMGTEQPFINYVTDLCRLRHADISAFAPELAIFIWARQPIIYDWKTDSAKNGTGQLMAFIHWPGCAYPTMVKPEIFLRHRTSGLSLPARIWYVLVFYLHRYRLYLLKEKDHAVKVITQLVTSSAWRKFYLCKLVGIKIKVPA
jgi:hypothetical protein